MLCGCSSKKLDLYKDDHPKMDIESYFTGPIKAWGFVQNRKGDVVTKFDVTMMGSWENGVGTLEEDFNYYDGKTQKRIWTLTKDGENKLIGKADDIIGEAKGEQKGSAFRFQYVMDIPVDGSTYRMTLDDWMWRMNDGVLINRSYIKKFGITFAELTLFMQKQDN